VPFTAGVITRLSSFFVWPSDSGRCAGDDGLLDTLSQTVLLANHLAMTVTNYFRQRKRMLVDRVLYCLFCLSIQKRIVERLWIDFFQILNNTYSARRSGPAVRAARSRLHFCRPSGIVFYRPIPYRYVALA